MSEKVKDRKEIEEFMATSSAAELTDKMRALLAVLPDEALADHMAEAKRMGAENEAAHAAA